MISTLLKQLCVYIVTWNVSTKYPDHISVTNLLGLDKNPLNDQHQPDFYVIGLQEVNTQPQNVVIGLFRDDPWTNRFKEVLKDRDYVAVKTEHLQGMLLILFAKRKHLLHIRDIETEYTRTGFGGFWGNKGAISIRLNIYGCGVTFVNSHLAAHDHQLSERIEDYNQILKFHHYHVGRYRQIFDHDYVFWFGDLNFRLENRKTPEEVRREIEHDRLKELLVDDQLILVRNLGKAFYQLEERLPSFPPTFKFEHGTSEYDMKRKPAWTDRILYRVKTDAYKNVALSIEQLSYKSHPGYNISDHKPVTSDFVIKVFDDPSEKAIEFSYIPKWLIGEENIIEYTMPSDYEEQSGDWIGVYKSGFNSLGEYIAYEYTNQEDRKSPRLGESGRNIRRSIRLEFSESIDLKDGESYILLYFQSTGIRGVTSLIGMSNVFQAEKRPPSPRFEAVD